MRILTDSGSFEDFKRNWPIQLADVKHILNYLNTYPNILKQFNFESLLTSEGLDDSQENWIKLYDKYCGQEKEFFKPYWIPIQQNSMSYFIDISNSNYPIFEAIFIFSEPYNYEKIILFDSINELMLAEYDKINFERTKEIILENRLLFYSKILLPKLPSRKK